MFSKIIPSFFTIKEGFFRIPPSPLQGELHFLPKPLFLRKRGCNCPTVLFFDFLRLPLAKGSSTSNQAFLLRRKDVTALLGAQNRYALRLADHQRSTPVFAGWDRLKLSATIAFSNSVLNIVISSKTFLEISIASFIFISPS